MKNDIIIAGVGGQGIVSIATVIGMAALKEGLYVKQAEVHGMSQRGGAVQSHMRISDKPVLSELITKGKGDLIISVEPMESLRYTPYLSEKGVIITNINPYKNINDYPSEYDLTKTMEDLGICYYLDADKIAKEIKSPRSSNIVILGAASLFIDLKYESLQYAIKKIFERKGEKVVDVNLKALDLGYEISLKAKYKFNRKI